MDSRSLSYCLSEVIVLTKKRVPTVLPIQAGEIITLSKSAMKYLEIRNIIDKVMAKMFAIFRLMSNIGGPLSRRCRLLMSAIQFVRL